MKYLILIKYYIEFFLFKIIFLILNLFSKKISLNIISNLFLFFGKFSKYHLIAKNNCKLVFPNLNDQSINKIINDSWRNLGSNLYELTYLKKLVNEHGVQIKSFNDDVWDSFGEAAAQVFEEVRDHSPLAKKIDDAFQKNLREIGGSMANLEGVFQSQRNRILGII